MSHGDKITAIPPGFEVVATSAGSPFAVIADEARRLYGVQFHPEVAHTPRGALILRNFTHRIAGLTGDWTMAAFRAEAVARIRAQVGGGRVICGLSGGVNSSVAAVLIHEAVGEQLTCVFVDTGLLRLNEAREVVELFRNHYNIPLLHVDASKKFISTLAGVSDPETKRKVIGRLFIDVFDKEAAKIEGVAFLAQGTLYPDVIESVSATGGPSAVIKSHHNVGGLPERMKLKLVEPLRELFKDEVRALGVELGLPAAFVGRHPFPGPGLAIRIPGEVTAEKVAILQQADAIWLEEIRAAGLYDAIWQAFAVLLPVNTVGVMGDARTYEDGSRPTRGDIVRRHDRRRLRVPAGLARQGRHPHRQRGSRRQPRRLRHHLQAAGNHRVGMTASRSEVSARVLGSDYMRFAKLETAARYNLASSGIADCALADFGASHGRSALHGDNACGYSPLVEPDRATLWRPGRLRGHPARGCSFANHLALAALVSPGDEVLVEAPTYELLTSTLRYLQADLRRFERRSEDGLAARPGGRRRDRRRRRAWSCLPTCTILRARWPTEPRSPPSPRRRRASARWCSSTRSISS